MEFDKFIPFCFRSPNPEEFFFNGEIPKVGDQLVLEVYEVKKEYGETQIECRWRIVSKDQTGE